MEPIYTEFSKEIICLNVHNPYFAPSFFQGIKVIVSLKGTFDCAFDGQLLRDLTALVVNRNACHTVTAPDAQLLVYYLDYRTPLAGRLRIQLANQEWLNISERIDTSLRLSWSDPTIRALIRPEDEHVIIRLLESLFPDTGSVVTLSDRTLTCIRFIDEHLQEPISLTQLANLFSLSVERTRHVFEEQMTMSFSQYLLWMRLRAVIEKTLQQQQPLYKAALEYGFTDQSHFCRIFKRTFGLQPRHLLKPNGRNHMALLAADKKTAIA